MAGLLVAAATTAMRGLPEPAFHDEYSYLLAADTFQHGRLSNPAHPHWQHFESFHVLQQPTYASKYPPGQGLLLALGQQFGHPIVGMWLGIAGLAAVTVWMLLPWVGGNWPLFGGLLVALHFGLPNYWSQGYWGGSLTAIGGMLVFGAMPRLLDSRRSGPAALRTGALFGAGLSLLALTRPLEGLLLGAVCSLTLAVGVARSPKRRVLTNTTLWPAALGVGSLLVAGLVFLGLYHHAVTGSATKFPYQVYSAQYASAPQFVWQQRGPMPDYRQIIHLRYWGSVAARFERLQVPSEQLTENLGRLLTSWRFFLGWTLSVPLVFGFGSRHGPWLKLCGALALVFAVVIWGYQSFHTHYLAPLLGPLIFAVVAGAERLAALLPGRRATFVVMLVLLGADMGERLTRQDPELGIARTRQAWEIRQEMASQLQALGEGGQHLIFVQLSLDASIHEAWVVNGAELDSQPVIWAHDLATPEEPNANRALLDYYSGRTPWLLQVPADPTGFRLSRLSE